MPNVAIIYHSSYGHLFQIANHIADGAREAGAEVCVRRVPELVPADVIAANAGLTYGAELQREVPLATIEDLEWADAVAFGSPTRFGNMSAPLKNFLDQTGGLWARGALVGKLAAFFTGAATMHGGHEATILGMSTYAYHHGMLIVPAGYDIPAMSTTQGGGTPYGASTLSGPDGSRQPDADEIAIARHLGGKLATYGARLTTALPEPQAA